MEIIQEVNTDDAAAISSLFVLDKKVQGAEGSHLLPISSETAFKALLTGREGSRTFALEQEVSCQFLGYICLGPETPETPVSFLLPGRNYQPGH